MKTYLVGGAVRDQLLNLEVTDKDWLVVGSSINEMLSLGYIQVGADFPVFLHPNTHQEYALARTERKSGAGYKGFICDFSPNVTLEQDLQRRDLTINAIAQDDTGRLYDPFFGQNDLNARLLRHVSSAFVEDPLRVLRVARFAARFNHLGFRIATETLTLMREISNSGELASLTPERVWKEWEKSLVTDSPEVFLQVLHQCGALAVILPEIAHLFGVPQPQKWHPEIDTGIHTLLVTKQAAALTSSPIIRFAATLHDLGKALTPKESWPKHHRHEQLGLAPIRALCERIKVPNAFRDCALLVCAEHSNVHRAYELNASTFVAIFDRCDAWRKPERIMQLTTACQADSQGRTGLEDAPYPQAAFFRRVFAIAQGVEVKAIVEDGFKGEAIRDELSKRRVSAVKAFLTASKA